MGIKIKTTTRYYYIPNRMVQIKKSTISNSCQGAEHILSHILLMEMENGKGTLEKNLTASYNLNIYFLCDPIISLLSIYSRKIKIYVLTKNLYTNGFIHDISKLGTTQIFIN